MSRIAIFIEGGHLDKIMANSYGGARLDFIKFPKWIAGDLGIFRVYYYDCLPYKSNPPTESENLRFSSKERFLDALERKPHFTVRKGRLEFRGFDKESNPIFTQKRVDVLLSSDLLNLSLKGKITHAALVIGDSDFIPAIQLAKDEGVIITLVHGYRGYHKDLYDIADFRKKVTRELPIFRS